MVRLRLNDALHTSIDALARTCEIADGVSPLNDDAQLNLAHRGERDDVAHALMFDGDLLVGYAQVDQHRNGTLCVHPEHRRRGLATALLAELRDVPADGWWAFGTLPPAQSMAASLGAHDDRALLILERPLSDLEPARPVLGVQLRGFTDADTDALLRINARAFAHHPEQGALSEAEFAQRRASEWFDPEGLIVAEREGRLVGFHWTKQHDATTGEVYVLATDPETQGTGVGRYLLQEGLAFLARRRCTHVILYVESDEIVPISLYHSAGFSERRRDTYYTMKG